MKNQPLPPEVLREASKQVGSKGGRPKTVFHPAGETVPSKGCRCTECRRARGWSGVSEQEKVEAGWVDDAEI
jgi:hypothetical protein